MTPFPWREAMRLGFGVLKLSSRDFWELTPRELAAAFAALSGPRVVAPDRGRLGDLMRQFPDEETGHGG
jgi:uncharacterized phage protein (TIGR02216 family)